MLISKIANQPIFGTSYRKVYQPDKPYMLDHESSTCCFKDDFPWNKSFDFFIDFYKNTDSVNVFSLGCSDCSESLSVAMLLDTKLGEKSSKFGKIISVDNDEGVLTNIRNGVIDLALDDEIRINKYTLNNLNKYLKRTNYTYVSDRIGDTDNRKILTRFEINPKLLDKILVINADVRDYVKTMPSANNLIFCRNMWVYLHPEQKAFLKSLSEKTDKNSFITLGGYDDFICPLTIENQYGFSMHPELINVYDKSGSGYFDDTRWLAKANFVDY